MEAAILGQLQQMGFSRILVEEALTKLGEKEATLEAVLDTLLGSKPSVRTIIVETEEDILEPVITRPAKAAKVNHESGPASPALLRGMSSTSQQVFSKTISRHSGVSQAAVARLLLRVSAASRQRLLSEEEKTNLLKHLEQGEVDLVQQIIAAVGVRSEPSMPLEAGEAAWECPVCFTEQEEQGWRCPGSHRYCSDCMRHHVDNKPFPRCPTVGCGYELGEGDLRLLQVPQERIETFKRAKLEGAVDALGSNLASGTASSSSAGPARTGSDNTEVVIRCPNPSCQNAVVVPVKVRRSYSCICGIAPFCTHCRQSPYHFHADCSDVGAIRRRWLDWVSVEREQHQGEAAKSASWEAQARALREGIDRHQELERDEQWKASNCRCCPHCSRPIQKLAGCSSMVCGSDAHGGNDQKGCGKTFDWGEAKRYKAKVDHRDMPKITSEEARCRGRDTLHAFVDCSLCGSEGKGIRGPRFRCIHCKAFDVCINCEPRLAELHTPDHVFQVMFESDFDWGSFRLPRGTRVRAVRRGEEPPKHVGPESGPKVSERGLEGLCGEIAKQHKKGAREEPPGRYQWQSDRGRWHDYSDDVNAAIVVAANVGETRIQIGIAGTRYELHLDRMRQRNMATRGQRPMRAHPAAVAEAAAARKAAEELKAYRVLLDTGGEVMVPAHHLDPILESRAEAEKLMRRAMEVEEKGDEESVQGAADEELEEDEEDEDPDPASSSAEDF